MKIYLIMQSNGYGNSAVNSVWATRAEAEVECKRLQTSQERYDNDYYVVEKELQGDTCGFWKETIYQRLELNRIDREPYEKEIERLTNKLKEVAENIGKMQIFRIQPSECVFGCGSCGYPIEDCVNCPCHPWSVNYMPLTSCEFK